MNRTQIQLTDEQVRGLKNLASAEGKSIAQLIRDAVDARLRSGVRLDSSATRIRAIEAAGKFNSGIPDLGTRHDDYLAGAYADGDLH